MLVNVGQCRPTLVNVGQCWPMLVNVGQCWSTLLVFVKIFAFLKIVLGKRKKSALINGQNMVLTNDFPPEKNSIGEREKMTIGQWVAAGVAQWLQHGVAQWRCWGVEQRRFFFAETIPVVTQPGWSKFFSRKKNKKVSKTLLPIRNDIGVQLWLR